MKASDREARLLTTRGEGLRRQLGASGTHVLEVLPPVVDTPATASSRTRKIEPAEVAEATLDALASRRPMALVGRMTLLRLALSLTPGLVGRIVGRT